MIIWFLKKVYFQGKQEKKRKAFDNNIYIHVRNRFAYSRLEEWKGLVYIYRLQEYYQLCHSRSCLITWKFIWEIFRLLVSNLQILSTNFIKLITFSAIEIDSNRGSFSPIRLDFPPQHIVYFCETVFSLCHNHAVYIPPKRITF